MWIGKVRVMSLTISAYIFVTFFADIGKRSLQQIIQRSETLENRMCSSYHECQDEHVPLKFLMTKYFAMIIHRCI